MYAMHPLKANLMENSPDKTENNELSSVFSETGKTHLEPTRRTEECCLGNMELAQAYVCPQKLENIYPPEEGLRMGTIFPNLSQPYAGRRHR